MLFRKWGCLVVPENSIFRKLKSVDQKKKPLTTKIILHFYFPFKAFPENQRERERERERARVIAISSPRRSRSRRQTFQSPLIAIAPLIEIASDRAVDRDLAFARSHRIRDRDRRFARSRSTHREITISRRRRDRDSDLGSWSTVRSSDDVQCRRWWFFSRLWLVFFWICVFLLLFQTPENIFRKIVWNATKHHGNIFLFQKCYVFSGKRFTATKHSLN